MNYQDTLDYLFTRLPVFSRIGAAAYKADLTNTIQLCEFLGNPHLQFKSIHVAGTNGKGSVSHMLAAILQQAGYKTGLYTSPHLKDFRERIKINGQMIPKDTVIGFTQRLQPLIESIEPSFFEITVGMAFDYFAAEKVDIAVIETGLGGRLDSTNIIHPELSIITNIDWDHMNLLGDTLEKIALEKAGIIKRNVPVVIGEATTLTRPLFEAMATSLNAPLTVASETRQVMDWHWQHHLFVEVADHHQTDHQVYELDLPGIYQKLNLLTVLEGCHQLRNLGWNVSEEIIHEALKKVKFLTGLHGRWETISTQPLTIIDVAHNVAGIKQLIQQIELTPHRELHIVLGMVNDKDIQNILELLPKTAYYYFTKAQIPRALSELSLMNQAALEGLHGESWPEVNLALKAAHERAHAEDLVIICGSIFLAGEVNH